MRRLSAFAAGVSSLVASGVAFAQTAPTDVSGVLATADVSSVKTWVLTTIPVVIAIALAFKGGTIAKRLISRA